MLTENHKLEFRRLACEFSPENLCCDGELSPEETAEKHARLAAEWRALEARVGRKVSEDEVWKWAMDAHFRRDPRVFNPRVKRLLRRTR